MEISVERVEWSRTTSLLPSFHSAGEARRFVGETLRAHDLSHMLDPVLIAVSELATNVILHAGTEFTVTLIGLRDTLVLEIEDHVQDEVPGLTGMAAGRQVRAMEAGTSGRGLELVSLLSREWGVTTQSRGSKTVWASFPSQAA